MFRDDTTAGSMFADAFVSPGNGVQFQWRATAGGTCGSLGVGGVAAPVWVRLTRTGTTFTAYYGADGLNWIPIGTNAIAMSGTVRAGLEVTAHNNSALCLAAFDHVATAAPAPPTGLTAFGGNGWVSLAWTASPGAVAYHVRRASTSGGPYTLLANPALNSYWDTGLANWSTWYYVVSAVNSLGESAFSAEVSVTPRSAPALSANSTSSQFTLAWPSWATGYTVLSATNLLAPVPWQPITNVPQNNGTTFTLPIASNGSQQFFRLTSP